MRCCTLDASATNRHIQLNGSCVDSTSKSLVFRLATFDNRACKQVFVNLCVDVLNPVLESCSVLSSCMSSVAFLPKELTSSNERCGVLELPSHHIGPLIQKQGEITMGSDPF